MGVMTDIIQKMRKEFHFMIITMKKRHVRWGRGALCDIQQVLGLLSKKASWTVTDRSPPIRVPGRVRITVGGLRRMFCPELIPPPLTLPRV